jgi:hypothetical protein
MNYQQYWPKLLAMLTENGIYASILKTSIAVETGELRKAHIKMTIREDGEDL